MVQPERLLGRKLSLSTLGGPTAEMNVLTDLNTQVEIIPATLAGMNFEPQYIPRVLSTDGLSFTTAVVHHVALSD